MAFEKLTDNIKELTSNTEQYIKTSAEYYKLSIFRNSMKGLIGFANVAIRATFALIALLFISVGVAIIIGESMENASAGYFIVGAFYVVVFLLIFAFAKKPIEKMLLMKYSKMAFNEKMSETTVTTAVTQPKSTIHESVH
ncbi:hypothetical protein EAX61_02095 [Dokdonia sinensis]|uniref:Phage holin family protein n=1 Tax=Dokdonia sinensis TaxID=2479847 RepID=A0A3M0GFY7_9FLAO|nr:phage holin family protein [Dokdonia sinensis]RMB63208.1 hypothetical protein EAX61_02095 [Dokdonia sinensis]